MSKSDHNITASLVSEGEDYGTEMVLASPSGNQRELRVGFATDGDQLSVYHTRVCEAGGEEAVYWNSDEFGEDPQLVLGAMLGGWLGHVDTRLGAAQPQGINPAEALIRATPEGEEISVSSPAGNGRTLRTRAGQPGEALMECSYMRVCDAEGNQVARWEAEQFAVTPETTLGELFGAYLSDAA